MECKFNNRSEMSDFWSSENITFARLYEYYEMNHISIECKIKELNSKRQ